MVTIVIYYQWLVNWCHTQRNNPLWEQNSVLFQTQCQIFAINIQHPKSLGRLFPKGDNGGFEYLAWII